MNKIFLYSITLVCLAVLTAHAEYTFKHNTNETDKTEIFIAEGNQLAPEFQLNLSKVVKAKKKKKPLFFITIVYEAPLSLSIGSRKSLVLIIDGKKKGFSPYGKVFRKDFSDSVYETAEYRVPIKLIKKIAEAKKVDVKLRGGLKAIDGSFSEENFNHFRRFLIDIDTPPNGT
ncbi:MAG TPA: hypothetical protein VN944_04035 [Nitrospiria bacterium]|nr:hypothetical protein [Nitrospiria bacterium]